MAQRPLLVLPRPEVVAPPKRGGGGSSPHLPSRDVQVGRFEPRFARLREVLRRPEGSAIELRDDPTSLAPERVIVFEIAGSVDDFTRAVARVPGFDFMAEYDTERPPDDLFAEMDTRAGREGQIRRDKLVSGLFYLAMPDVAALRQLVSLWERWQRGERLGRGFAAFQHLFAQLRDLRPWGIRDRIPDETIRYWREEMERAPDRPVRTEVELWFFKTDARRLQASQRFAGLVTAAGGAIIHEAVVSEIAYHGMLINVPAAELPALVERREVSIALADDVMFLRPQSLLRAPLETEPAQNGILEGRQGRPAGDDPVAALLDGVPLQGHYLLANRLIFDDPDDLQSQAVASRRVHGTAMASLILHGDLNVQEPALDRPLYVRPLMSAPAEGSERTREDRLVVDTIHRAVLRMKGSEGEEATAPRVFLVNLSMGDARRPFSGPISPLARLLDFLSERYALLFLVSGGNVPSPLTIDGFATWSDVVASDPDRRERAVLKALNDSKHERTILSPGESLNCLTIGAQHEDNVHERPTSPIAVDPFQDGHLPNPSSALGLGFRRAVKPDLYLPGGREHLRMITSRDPVRAGFVSPARLFGISAAAPDISGQARLNYIALSDGTSSATALATRAAHRIFDALMDRQGGSAFADMPPEFYAVVVKALLVHRAQWNDNSLLLKEICGPDDGRRWRERGENASRFIGFGIPSVAEVFDCAPNRATLVGFGTLRSDEAHSYRIPLPGSLEGVTDPRTLTITIAWFSPIRPGYQSYRRVKLDAQPLEPAVALGVNRWGEQPPGDAVKRGTVFHERFFGERAVPFIDTGHLGIRVWCKDDDVGDISQPTRYGIAITLETATPIPVYAEIRERLRVRPRPRA
jgi:Subtilase family